MKKLIVLVMALAVVLSAGSIMAATTPGTLTASASVGATCSVVANPTIAFGAYDPTSGTPVDNSANLQFRCTKGAAWEVTIDNPDSVGRRMQGAVNTTEFLSYQIYYEGARSNAWEEATGIFGGSEGKGTSGSAITTITVPIYGRIAASQDVAVDNYNGTLAVTINY